MPILVAGCASEPASSISNQVVLIYTGGTRSILEAGKPGSLSRRTTVIRDLLSAHPQALVLDAGDLFDGISELDQKRNEAHLKGMAKIPYRAANLGAGEFRFGGKTTMSLLDSSDVAFVASNIASALGSSWRAPKFRVFESGGRHVAVFGVTSGSAGDEVAVMGVASVRIDSVVASVRLELEDPAEALRKGVSALPADVSLVIVLSDLPEERNRHLAESVPGLDVIIGSRSRRPTEQFGATLLLGTLPFGEVVGKAVLDVRDDGTVHSTVDRIPVEGGFVKAGDIDKIVQDFYTKIGTNPELREAGLPRFIGFEQEKTLLTSGNGYVGAKVCGDCHAVESRDWHTTPHAKTFDRLQKTQSHFRPDCVTCHATGYGYPSGFAIGQDPLGQVQCESCHGPGAHHVRRPERENIRGRVGVDVCQACHTARQTPDLEERFQEMISKVDHRDTTIEQALTEEIARAGGSKPKVELFVMAQCPYGIEAEAALAPTILKFSDQIDFRLHFIAEEAGREKPATSTKPQRAREGPACEADVLTGSGRFRSLHGDPEIEEGIRQVVIMALYPERYFEYILCRNKEIYLPNWASCAERVGMDPDKIRALAKAPRGQVLFQENIRRANLLGINASPTLLVNGREIRNVIDAAVFERSICEENPELDVCVALPTCNHDRDCSRANKVGICADPGSPEAICEYREPIVFEMVVLNDAGCTLCETGHFIRSTRELFPGVNIRSVEVTSPEGKAMVDRYGIDRVPAFVIDKAFENTARFDRFARTVRTVENAYIPEAMLVPISRLLAGEWSPGKMDVFLDPESAFSMGLLSHVLVWLEPEDALDRVRFRFSGKGSQIERQHLCVEDRYPDQSLDYLKCRAKILLDPASGQTEAGCLDALDISPDELQRCVSGEADGRLVDSAAEIAGRFGIGHKMAPAVVIGNQVVVTGAMVRGIRDLFYQLHPELAARDENYPDPGNP